MKRKLALMAVILIIAVIFTGCAKSADYAPESAAMDTGNAYGYYSNSDAADVEYDVVVEETTADTSSNVFPEGAKIIYTADMQLETTEFDKAAQELENLTARLSGYFESTMVNNYGTYRYAEYVVRVPQENFEEYCEAAGNICQRNSINKYKEDISEVYYDTDARLETQQTKLERLQELLAQAETMEDIITIETAISETEYQIDMLTGELRRYDSLVNYSTVTIWLEEVYKLSGTEEPAIGFWAKLGEAFEDGIDNAIDILENIAIGLAYSWIGILIFVVIVAAVVLIIRSVLKKDRKKREKLIAERKEQENK